MKATHDSGCRWKIIDGKDLITAWLSNDGMWCHRIKDFETDPIGFAPILIPYESLVLAAEGQGKLL